MPPSIEGTKSSGSCSHSESGQCRSHGCRGIRPGASPDRAGSVALGHNPPGKVDAGKHLPSLIGAQEVLRESFSASFSSGLVPEMLTTIAPNPWTEIVRVAKTHRCESLLIGLTDRAE